MSITVEFTPTFSKHIIGGTIIMNRRPMSAEQLGTILRIDPNIVLAILQASDEFEEVEPGMWLLVPPELRALFNQMQQTFDHDNEQDFEFSFGSS